ncbi:MAG: hypothetical protein CFK52_00290 [Chloracidobacterium sp. CP2_5A]|nr:MAG: hypothetical protein CFK52_00290 [Chloracidobacterium sp. CP2_5A]
MSGDDAFDNFDNRESQPGADAQAGVARLPVNVKDAGLIFRRNADAGIWHADCGKIAANVDARAVDDGVADRDGAAPRGKLDRVGEEVARAAQPVKRSCVSKEADCPVAATWRMPSRRLLASAAQSSRLCPMRSLSR